MLDMGACWACGCRTSSSALITTESWVTAKRCKTWVELELASSLRRVVSFAVSSGSYWCTQPWRKLSLSFVSKRRPMELAAGGFKVTTNS